VNGAGILKKGQEKTSLFFGVSSHSFFFFWSVVFSLVGWELWLGLCGVINLAGENWLRAW